MIKGKRNKEPENAEISASNRKSAPTNAHTQTHNTKSHLALLRCRTLATSIRLQSGEKCEDYDKHRPRLERKAARRRKRRGKKEMKRHGNKDRTGLAQEGSRHETEKTKKD